MENTTQVQENIKYFIKIWTDKIKEKEEIGKKLSEKGNTRQFWIDLIMNVFNIDSKDITSFIEFDKQVKHINETIGYIDVFIKNTRVLIEQKSSNIDFKNTYIWRGVLSQAEEYAKELSYSENPRWIILCNFKTFLIYDRERPQDLPKEILLENLGKEYEKLNFLIDKKYKEKKRERISRDAGEIISNLYNAFLKQYKDIESEKTQKDLNELCMRLVFCFYADDLGLFGERGIFKKYLENEDLNAIRLKLINVFKILNTEKDKRNKYLEEELKKFPYVNGGLFSNEEIEIPNFTEEIKENLLAEPKGDFRWSEITPIIFGSVFESTLNPETRRKGGMHYTSLRGENIFIEKISKPLNDNVPKIHIGCVPFDGGSLIIEEEAYKEFIKKEPKAKKYIKKLIGSGEFLNNKKRYCLWLEGVSSTEIRSMPLVMERVEKCREFRLKSPSKSTRKLAETPYRFGEIYNYDKYMVIPLISNKNIKYIPMGFIYNKDTVSKNSNLIIKDADLYHFGILESIVHMIWVKGVCNKLKSDYRYSIGVVYNNFPWPEVNEEQRGKIKETAQGILDTRTKYPNSSLADLYCKTLMPEDLRKAHEANDKAVKRAYGFKQDITEEEIFTELIKMHNVLKGGKYGR